ncbi:MAG TPA: WYL domain-containing protein [Gemmatimonadaceae bacterium]|nr:WYL domain-containing protein [Gemmatimonadaceae bacterium]
MTAVGARTVEDAAAQLKRLLLAIPAIGDDAPHAIADVARAIGTDGDTLARDLRTLVTRFGDEEPGFVEGVRLLIGADTVELHSTLFRRPMGLTRSELCALELGLSMLRREVAPSEQPTVDAAIARVRAAATGVRGVSSGGHGRDGRLAHEWGAAHVPTLRTALRERRAATMRYASSPGRRGGKDRVVHPYGLIFSRGHWFLVAHCERARAVRVFRADRIISVGVLRTKSVTLPEGFSLHEVLDRGRVLMGAGEQTLTVRYSQRIARWISEREQGAAQPDGSFVVEYPLLDTEWAVRHVLQYGPDAEVVAPEKLRVTLVARLAKLKTGRRV